MLVEMFVSLERPKDPVRDPRNRCRRFTVYFQDYLGTHDRKTHDTQDEEVTTIRWTWMESRVTSTAHIRPRGARQEAQMAGNIGVCQNVEDQVLATFVEPEQDISIWLLGAHYGGGG